ncbi:PAF acetylhydrolase family protein [Lindgomyces ingoldianus]|uniref:PAF acetylhydrolase family protein n=1 Tax=Lindgomyces ingoldianus TaxID=673940 RepID=A0ACB6RDH1_9PLEO|nr:PAF acetylhydrolase family protein [Lindgomyces ingoldianus]KAF2476377.1 PAF acetylhydrolase family protein [Lindgomyces ingoldianus]
MKPLSLHFLVSLSFWGLARGEILIPEPGGPYAVGYNTMKLVDESRIDPYDPGHGKRNVMMSLFYPVAREDCQQMCSINYMPPITATFEDGFAAELGLTLPNGTFASINWQSCCKVSHRGIQAMEKFPVVLFSPGLGGSRLLYSAMAQKLASAGYAVATMDHTYEGVVVEYPDGSYIVGWNQSYLEYLFDPAFPERVESVLDIRVQDAQFVLTQLGQLAVVKSLIPGATCAFNIGHSGFYGHSFGGATALAALARDHRLNGGLNLDGSQYGVNQDIHRPAMLFGRDDPHSHNRTNDATWAAVWDHMKGWRRELGLSHSQHTTFMDAPLLIKMAGLPDSDVIRGILGELDGARAFEIITKYVEAFMDFALKGRRSELFSGPSKAYPEIRVS